MRAVTHLDAGTYERLRRGTLPPAEVRALARHLEGACETCEAFLASLPAADGLDGRVEAALGALPVAGAQGSDLEFARIERRLRGDGAPARRSGRIVAGMVAAAVLAVGLAGVLAPRPAPERPGWDGLKGTGQAIPVRLRFVVLAPREGGPSVEKGVSGQEVSASASLQFEVETGRPAAVALVRVPVGGAPEIFWRARVGQGRTTVEMGGRPAAYPLSGLSGPQRFVLVASAEEPDETRLAAAARAISPRARTSSEPFAADGLSLDLVEVEVR